MFENDIKYFKNTEFEEKENKLKSEKAKEETSNRSEIN